MHGYTAEFRLPTRRVRLRGMMHTTEFLKNLNISAKSKLKSQIFYYVYQGPRWVRIMEKIDVENVVTHVHSKALFNKIIVGKLDIVNIL